VNRFLANNAEAPALTAADFRKISRLAHENFGLCLPSGKEELVAARLSKKIRQGGFASFAEYYRHVVEDRTGESLIELIDSLTTNHTFFMRERAHFDFLGEIVTGEFRGHPALRIWSAACSTGEEPYTIAMHLKDISQKTSCRWSSNLQIRATDISTRVLQKAQQAIYDADRFRDIPEGWWQSYLLRGQGASNGKYKVKPEIARSIEFERLNLIEPLPRRTFDIIFLRNVMMYFDKPTQQDIVLRVVNCMEPGGYLFVGHSEALTGIEHPLRYVRPATYQRENAPGRARTSA
jgi:chemotaxis protein methyltransferase CheR